MALESARHEAVHGKTGQALADIKAKFDDGFHSIASDNPDNHPEMAAIIYQIQKMQDELNYLRGIIDANNDKVSMTLGTSSTTALAGDTTTISTAQAREISRSTIHNTKLDIATPANLGRSTAITFGEFTTTVVGKTTTYSLPVTVTETTVTNKGSVTLTKTGSITLT